MMDWGNGYGYGGGWGMWLMMFLVMIVFWGGLAWVIVSAIRHSGGHHAATDRAPGQKDALQILEERLAHGDIDVEEYRSRRDALRSNT